ncbi:DUF4198 domain-containing protein [Cupriavidus pauculus]|uniref:DUF4198 domain-containing protein n=1 Tax=Cupriavidus pauculus TaxID=82633 RepID=UPI001EE3553E|nr:DUF4198 domain-containing protein [Cupriavidus pauculus]GJG98393.1 hypothetical protein CBA19C6_27910 [Cupriavidus pauculus]
MKRHTFLSRLALVLAVLAPAAAQAHYLWLEQDKAGGHLYFGEYEEMLRERSPGRLDEMPAPVIRSVNSAGQASDIQAKREAGGFAFAAPARGTAVVATEAAYEVKDWTRAGIGIVKPMFYARFIGATVQPDAQAMTLDILPTGKRGEYRVVFQGAPLASTDVRIIAPNAWTREATTGKDGLVHFEFPWHGQYILHVVHLEKTPGQFNGVAYTALRHRMTATVNVAQGPATQVPTQWGSSQPH